MNAERWKQIDELVDAALEMSGSEREKFVTSTAADDVELRDAVLELLTANKESDSFLQRSAMRMAAEAAANDETEVSAFAFINKKVATYKVERLLGAGGMGEVYLAFDEKLKRKVALKILPAEFVSNDERVKRFEMEARAIASLNHPGIVTVYDVGNFEGVNYIATEFVEGKTLRDLIGGKFKLRNIILNSIQLCDALSAAHAVGIIHRDIKPENIMIRKDGYAKILDFGLAKLTDVGQQTMRDFAATSKGVIIGTPAYMSPAQISDEKVDHRTDLWSSGVVMYEFLTGKNPFKGANRQETFQAILSKEAPLCSSLNPEVPEDLDRIIAKLLEKDPGMGYQSATDLRADLKRVRREVDSSPSWSGHTSSGSHGLASVARSPYFVAAILAAILVPFGLLGYFYLRPPKPQDGGIDWAKARSVQITNQTGTEYFPSLSPDGKDIVYAAEENGFFAIFLQRVGGKRRDNLTKDSKADNTQPAFSPDGNLIAFRSEREPKGIYTIEISGDNLRRVTDFGFHPSWSPNKKEIVVSTFGRDQPTVRSEAGQALMIVDVQSGTKRELLKAEATFPAWSPNGHRIAYWYYTGTFGRREIATISSSGGEPVPVAKDFAVSNWNPVWSADGKFLYFVSSRGGNMKFWRVAIDEVTGNVSGEPEPVVTSSVFSRHLSFSKDGKRMAYVQTNNTSNIQGIQFDDRAAKTAGTPFWITEGHREISRAELSPDGSQFVMRLIRPTQDDIVIVGRDGRDWRDVTNDEPFDRYVRWSPDGKRLAFNSDRNGGGQVWIANSDGTGMRQLTFTSTEFAATGFPVWSPDGSKISTYFDGKTSLLNPDRSENEQEPFVLPELNGLRIVVWDWSPDGMKLSGVIADGPKRHIGYFSLETNSYHIVVENSPALPSWLPDSRRFVYSVGSKVFVADAITKEIRELFENPGFDVRSPFVSRDGKLLYYTAAKLESDIWLLDALP